MTQLENENGPRDPKKDTLDLASARRAADRARYGANLFRAHDAPKEVQGQMDEEVQKAQNNVLDTQRKMIEGSVNDSNYVEGLEELRKEINNIQGNDGPMNEKTEARLRNKKTDEDDLDPVGNL